MGENLEQRRYPRFSCGGVADVAIVGASAHCPARIMDLSREGCLLALQIPRFVAEGATVELTFTVNQLPFRVRATVCSLRSEKKAGCEFSGVSQRTLHQLDELIEELLEADRKLPDRRPTPV